MSVDTEKIIDNLVNIQPKEPKQKKPRVKKTKEVIVPPPTEPVKRPKLVKGSQEAKDYMAMLRNKRKTKQTQQ